MEKNHPRVLEALTTQPWLCTEEGIRQMMAIASYEGDVEALKTRMEERDPHSYKATHSGNTAIIPVNGPIFPKANLMTDISGATALSQIAMDFRSAEDNESITNILLDVSSPGGVVDGINEAAEMIRASDKRVTAYVGATAASAAYWLAAACDEIVIDATARLGSIGVVAGIPRKKDDDKLEFTNTASPKKRLDIETKEGVAAMTEQLDALADVFIGSVARFRNVSVSTVEKQFGEGGMLVGQAAVDAGMADRLGSYDALLDELTNNERGGKKMDLSALTKEDLIAKRGDLVTAITQEALSAVEGTHAVAIAASTEQVTALSAENETLKAENASLKQENTNKEDRVAALEQKDAIRTEQALNAQAEGIISARLSTSTVPARLQPKVRAGISKEGHVVEGALDVDAFTASVDAEVKDWEESISTPGAVMGIGGINRGGEEDFDASEEDAIVARLSGEK